MSSGVLSAEKRLRVTPKFICGSLIVSQQHKSIVYEPRDKITDVLMQKYLVEWYDYWLGMIVQGSKK